MENIKIPITKAVITHIDKTDAREKVTSLKFNNRAIFIYDNDWIVGVEYKNENGNYSE